MNKYFIPILVILTLSTGITYAAFDTTVFQPQATYSGVNSTSTTAVAYTLAAQDVIGYSTIILTPNTASTTLTLPASSTLASWVPQAGQRINMFLFDGSTTPGVNIGIIAGSGSLIENASSTATTTSSKAMELDVMRKPNGDLLWSIVPFI